MATGINSFRGDFKGLRPNRFTVNGAFPTAVSTQPTRFDIYCKATQMPGSSIGVIPVPWMGRVVKFSGERTYADWTIQVYESSIESQDLRKAMEEWIELMDGRETHQVNYDVTATWEIYYDDFAGDSQSTIGNPIQSSPKTLHLVNCFPVDISPVDLSYDSVDTFSEFTLTMAYDYWNYGPATSAQI